MSTQQIARTPEQKAGDAFTHTLLRSSERDFADSVILGSRLVEELRKRGLAISPITKSPSTKELVR